jgi:hypothetical protein
MLEPGFKKWIRDTDTVILVCWDLGHIWDADIYDSIEKRPHGAHLLIGTCDRGCGVERSRYLTSSWSIDSSHNTYRYPHNYSPRGLVGTGFFMDREHRSAIRREIARRYKAGEETGTANVDDVKTNVIQASTKFSG